MNHRGGQIRQVVQRFRDGPEHLHGFLHRELRSLQNAAVEQCLQAGAGEKLHDEVRHAARGDIAVINRHDSRVLQCCHGAHLRHEPAHLFLVAGRVLGNDLDSHLAVKALLAGIDNGAHAAGSDLVEL